jgi:hypothetical protein
MEDLILLSHDPDSVPISEITWSYVAREFSPEDAYQVWSVIAAKALPDSGRIYLQEN